VLHGGLPAGRTTHIWGGSGCGKTLLALECLYRGALAGEPSILVAFEEPVARVRQNALTLGWDLAPLEAAGKFLLIDGVPDPAVIGILEVERERAHLRTAEEALEACASWLKTIARAHDLLAAGSFAPMDLRDFIAVVAGGIQPQAGAGAAQIQIVYDQVSLKLPPKPFLALACITNELILNAIKHAFHGRAHGRIEIRAWDEGDQYFVEVRDDGIGVPAGAEVVGTGLEIVATLCGTDLRGDCRFLHDGGTTARIAFPKTVAAAGAEP
jgi:two-component sensor histidine kinase